MPKYGSMCLEYANEQCRWGGCRCDGVYIRSRGVESSLPLQGDGDKESIVLSTLQGLMMMMMMMRNHIKFVQ